MIPPSKIEGHLTIRALIHEVDRNTLGNKRHFPETLDQ